MVEKQDTRSTVSNDVNRYSLRRRLVMWLLVPAIVIAVLALWDAYNTALDSANSILDRVLSGSAAVIAEKVELNENGKLVVDVGHVNLDMLPPAELDELFYRIETADGNFIAGNEMLAFPKGAEIAKDEMAFWDTSYQQIPVRAVVFYGSASSGVTSVKYRILVAETTNTRGKVIYEFLSRTVVRFIVILSASFIAIWVTVGISLRPLSRLQQAIDQRSPDELRAIDHHVPQEVSGLIDTINSFMNRLDNALNALRNFTGNASHQLRTPLTIIRTQLALASRANTLEEAQEAAKRGDEAVAHAERILSQLLLLARVDQANSHRTETSRIDLNQIAKQVTEQYLPMAATHKNDLGFQPQTSEDRPVFCLSNAMLIEELLRNLIENAIKYSGEGSEITVRVFSNPGVCVLEVEDDGPGIPAELRVQVRARFSRVAVPPPSFASNSKPTGAGLGLAIVSEIAKLFDGSLDLFNGRDHKGLVARVSFPMQNKRV